MKNSTKLLLSILSLSFFLTTTSCDEDDPGSSFEFIDQNLQGTIDGLPYTFGEGTADAVNIDGENELSFDLLDADENFTAVCDLFGFGDEVSILFSTPNEVGLYELFFDLSSFDGQTVTLLNPNGEGGVPNNIIASTGAVEILTITDSEVTGRIDARFDGDNTVNGNFTVIFCSTN